MQSRTYSSSRSLKSGALTGIRGRSVIGGQGYAKAKPAAAILRAMPWRPLVDRWSIPLGLGCVVVAFAAASSSSHWVHHHSRSGRWLVLAAVCAAIVAVAAKRFWVERRPAPRGLLRVGACAGAFLALAFLSASWSVAPRLSVERAAWMAGAPLLVGSTVAAESRGPLLAVFVGMCTVFLFALPEWRPRLVGVTAALLVCVGGVALREVTQPTQVAFRSAVPPAPPPIQTPTTSHVTSPRPKAKTAKPHATRPRATRPSGASGSVR